MRRFRTSLSLVASAILAVSATGAATAAPVAPALSGPPGATVVRTAPVATDVTFASSAWGSTVTVAGPLVNSGRTANTALACTQDAGLTRTNSLASVNIPGLAQLGAVSTYAATGQGPTAEVSVGRSRVAGASLLDGQIEIGAIESLSKVTRQSGNYTPSTNFSIASLTVLGEEIEIGTEEQTIEVDGLATITLNKELLRPGDTLASAVGTAVTVKVLETGAVIRIGESRAALDGRIVTGSFFGGAYGAFTKVGSTITSGPIAARGFPCIGTGGDWRSNRVDTTQLGGLGEANGVVSRIRAEQTPLSRAEATNRVAGVELLDGVVQIGAIDTAIEVWRDENGDLQYEPSAEIASIKVAGLNITVPTRPGAVVQLPLVGRLEFMDVNEISGGLGAEVVGARIVLLDNTVIVLSRSAASIRAEN